MAVKFIAETDTLEKFRTEFNDLSANQFGDIANLSGAIVATNLVAAMNETISIATSTAGFTIRDETSSTQIIGGGNTLSVLGTTNQIQAVVSATDTLTIGLPNDITIPNNLTALGTTHTLGSFEISGNNIRSVDTNTLSVLDTLRVSELETGSGLLSVDENSSIPRFTSSASGKALTFDAVPLFSGNVEFDGATAGGFKTAVTVVDPTADRTITLPDITGTIITTGDTGTITSTMIAPGTLTGGDIADDSIGEAKIADDAIGQDQLKSVVNLQVLNSSGGILKSIYGAGA
tara:strand:- start:3647 stop:4516 length:870 start_codon:yes stop_codon:yes gene_type:complete